ncbi:MULTISPECIES: serine hydrolase [unclassified Saccharothrix]|uniref:serine hydrolase n=1 Tax=unclassified Saccharothrix TaxID=2593673 RepID=UPI00307D7600
MPLTRRALLTACGCALLLPGTAAASDWPSWLRSHRQHVAFVVDDGRGGRLAHRPHEPQPLASTVHLLHLAAYARAVREGRVDPAERVRVGDWERHLLPLDRRAHTAALRHLGIRSTNGVTADDPHTPVALDDLAAVMTSFADNTAADFLRTRLDPSLPSPLGEGLRLVLGRSVEPARYLTDPRLQLEVLGRSPGVSPDEARARTTAHGTAAELHRLLRTPVPHLDRRQDLPPGVAALWVKLGTLPGVVTAAVRVRWEDGRVGTGVVLAREVPQERFADAMGLPAVLRSALLDPAALREFHVGLT